MIDVILPALNEAPALPSVLAGIPDGFRAIVVDNASTDDTAAVASGLGAFVVHEPQRGFGAACWAGLQAATADITCFMDCDGSFFGGDLVRVVAPLAAGDADLVLGARRPESGAWPLHARVANRGLAALVTRRTGAHVRDIGPMRAAFRVDLLGLHMTDRRFGWPLEMILRAGKANWRIEETDVRYAPRIGRSKVTGTVRGTARAIRDMSRIATSLR